LIELYNYPLSEIEKVYNRLFDKNLFKTIDIIGVDITYNIIKNLKEQDDNIYLPKILKESVENNILGKKNGTSIKKYFEEIYRS
jgi:3-hydroxyacyl-CoA dehydrogenase